MGGKALKINTSRMTTKQLCDTFEQIKTIVKDNLGIDCTTNKSYRSKADHGDLDIIIPKIDTNELLNFIKNTLKSKDIYINTPVISFEYNNFQIDFILVEKEYLDTSRLYLSYDPFGNIMGKITFDLHLTYGMHGLYYQYRNYSGIDPFNISISTDTEKIHTFFGLDYQLFNNVGFNTLEEIFDYIHSSRFYDNRILRPENMRGRDRRRNKKRTTFHQFKEYSFKKQKTSQYYGIAKEESFKLIIDFFPECNLKEKINEQDQKIIIRNNLKEKLNGFVVMDCIPNINPKNIDFLISKFKNLFSNEAILNMSNEEIKNKIIELNRE